MSNIFFFIVKPHWQQLKKMNLKVTLGITWQPPIIGSFYNRVKLLLKDGSQRQREPNEGRARPPPFPHCWMGTVCWNCH